MTERSTVEILRAARERIAPLESWTREAYARDVRGYLVGAATPDAVSWCAVGAVRAETGTLDDRFFAAVDRLSEAAHPITVMQSNDAGPGVLAHRRVLDIYDQAIAIELAEASS